MYHNIKDSAHGHLCEARDPLEGLSLRMPKQCGASPFQWMPKEMNHAQGSQKRKA